MADMQEMNPPKLGDRIIAKACSESEIEQVFRMVTEQEFWAFIRNWHETKGKVERDTSFISEPATITFYEQKWGKEPNLVIAICAESRYGTLSDFYVLDATEVDNPT